MEQAAIDIIIPVLETSFILASKYSNACGRSYMTAQDFEYALKYCARNTVGNHVGSIFQGEDFDENDDEDDDEDFDEDDVEIVEEEEGAFTRYDGDDEAFLKVNESVDTWDEWEPYSPAEQLLKSAIDSNEHFVVE